jgi:hypothetical protein
MLLARGQYSLPRHPAITTKRAWGPNPTRSKGMCQCRRQRRLFGHGRIPPAPARTPGTGPSVDGRTAPRVQLGQWPLCGAQPPRRRQTRSRTQKQRPGKSLARCPAVNGAERELLLSVWVQAALRSAAVVPSSVARSPAAPSAWVGRSHSDQVSGPCCRLMLR